MIPPSDDSRDGAPSPGRARRWGRRFLRGLVKTALILTVASLTVNALLARPETLNAPGGHDVTVADDSGHRTHVHYDAWGTQGTPLVLVHGFAESSVAWSLTAQELARHHRVFALDLVGSGYTQYTGRQSLHDQGDLVAGFVRTLRIGRPVVVGHSLGAAVVGDVALRHPGSVSGVVFADGDAMAFSGRGAKPGRLLDFALHTPYVTSLYRLGTQWSQPAGTVFDAQCGSRCSGLSGQAGARLEDAWMRPLRQRAFEDALWRSAQSEMLHLTPAQVRHVAAPRAIVWGAEDATSGGSLTVARQNWPGAHVTVVANAGHLSMVADPRGFARALETSLQSMGLPDS